MGGVILIPGGSVTSAVVPFSLIFQSSATSNDSTSTTIDYGTMTYGASGTRIVVGIIWANHFGGPDNTITGITIGGVSLAQVPGAFVSNGVTSIDADIWVSSAPLSGSSGDVQVTWSGSNGGRSSVALYNLVTTTPAVSAVKNAVNAFGNPVTLGTALVVPSGGGAIAITGGQNGTAISSFPNAAQDAAQINNQYYYHTTATGSLTLSATYVGNDGLVLSCASWGP